MKRLIFDLTKIPFLKCLIGICRLIVEVLNDQNLFAESILANLVLNYVQFCSGGHFSEQAEAAWECGKMNHLEAKRYCDWPPFSSEYESADCNV